MGEKPNNGEIIEENKEIKASEEQSQESRSKLDKLNIDLKKSDLGNADKLKKNLKERIENRDKNLISVIQVTLKRFGYYKGPVNGVYGQDVEDAISKFREEYNNLHKDKPLSIESNLDIDTSNAIIDEFKEIRKEEIMENMNYISDNFIKQLENTKDKNKLIRDNLSELKKIKNEDGLTILHLLASDWKGWTPDFVKNPEILQSLKDTRNNEGWSVLHSLALNWKGWTPELIKDKDILQSLKDTKDKDGKSALFELASMWNGWNSDLIEDKELSPSLKETKDKDGKSVYDYLKEKLEE